tara:strand:- start:299 stop:478 length:180 start_codon:yes stop_codon:yes gene_type:complete
MSGRMASAWFKWVEAKVSRLEFDIKNLEESLASYKQSQKRMLYAIMVMVIINGVLLFFK